MTEAGRIEKKVKSFAFDLHATGERGQNDHPFNTHRADKAAVVIEAVRRPSDAPISRAVEMEQWDVMEQRYPRAILRVEAAGPVKQRIHFLRDILLGRGIPHVDQEASI